VKSGCGGRTGGYMGAYVECVCVFGWRRVLTVVWSATLVGCRDGIRCNER
jgi:hypothetical protein